VLARASLGLCHTCQPRPPITTAIMFFGNLRQ
jgi:hypothetical protein